MTNKELTDGNNIFLFRGKKYRCHSFCFEPSITMECVEDGKQFNFGTSAPIRNEFVVVDLAKQSD